MLIYSHVINVDFNGIVIFSYPDLLSEFPNGIKEGENVLELFTRTELGDKVVDTGLVIPIINIDDGGYLVRFFVDEGSVESPNRQIAFSDPGYVLTVKEQVFVADAAIFLEWQEGLSWKQLPIPKGNYAVTIEGVVHLDEKGEMLETGYDVILHRVDDLPKRSAQIREDSRVPFNLKINQ